MMARLPAFLKRPGKTKAATSYELDDGRYDARRYWTDRHRSYRHSFRGVGDIDRSDEENIRDYVSAVGSITQLLSIAVGQSDRENLSNQKVEVQPDDEH